MKINIVIPMAGNGSRFSTKQWLSPKPFINVGGEHMINLVIRNINCNEIEPHFIFIVQDKHKKFCDLEKYGTTIFLKKVTEGAVCTTLLAKSFINNQTPLVLINSDQYIDWDQNKFWKNINTQDPDGCLLCFHQPKKDPKWSYCKVVEGLVTEVKEKQPISNIANVGMYYWKHGADYVSCAEELIEKNIRHSNNEFYIAPVYNLAIEEGKQIIVQYCNRMWGLGVPEDLCTYYRHLGSENFFKVVVFDLDGVLVNTQSLHFDALNEALEEYGYKPIKDFYKYDGYSTRQKLQMLDIGNADEVYMCKQMKTFKKLENHVKPDIPLQMIVKKLSQKYLVGVASNSIRMTVDMILRKIGLYDLIHISLSNEDVENPKPAPDIYRKMQDLFHCSEKEMIVFEDNEKGFQSVQKSGSALYKCQSVICEKDVSWLY